MLRRSSAVGHAQHGSDSETVRDGSFYFLSGETRPGGRSGTVQGSVPGSPVKLIAKRQAVGARGDTTPLQRQKGIQLSRAGSFAEFFGVTVISLRCLQISRHQYSPLMGFRHFAGGRPGR
jgi:hypothetical protein